MPRPLDAREYKMLLDPQSIGTSDEAAERWLRGTLRPLVDDVLGRDARSVSGPKRRRVHFLDTPARALDDAGLSLRFRSEAGEDDEYTLKLRIADRFVAAAEDIAASEAGEDKFEEDIAPLEALSGGTLTIADPPDIRSRFALSVDEPASGRLATLGDALDMFPKLGDILRHAGVPHPRATPLRKGPGIEERVFKGPTRDFGRGVEGEFALTLWTLAPPAPVERVAEVSWRCDLAGDHMPGPPARAALALFRRMQRGLAIDLRHPSKTKLALPPREA